MNIFTFDPPRVHPVLWAVVANAGIFEFKEFEWFTSEEISRTLDINVLGVSRTALTFLPLLRESRGRLLIVSSYAGKTMMRFRLCRPFHTCNGNPLVCHRCASLHLCFDHNNNLDYKRDSAISV